MKNKLPIIIPLGIAVGGLLFYFNKVKGQVQTQLARMKFKMNSLSLKNIHFDKSDLVASIKITNADAMPALYTDVKFYMEYTFNGSKLGYTSQSVSVNIPPYGETNLDVTARLNHLQVGLGIISMLTGSGSNDLHVKGSVDYAGHHVVVDHVQKLNV